MHVSILRHDVIIDVNFSRRCSCIIFSNYLSSYTRHFLCIEASSSYFTLSLPFNLNKATYQLGSCMPFVFSSVVVNKEIFAFLKLIFALQRLKVCCSLQVHHT